MLITAQANCRSDSQLELFTLSARSLPRCPRPYASVCLPLKTCIAPFVLRSPTPTIMAMPASITGLTIRRRIVRRSDQIGHRVS